MTRAFDVTPQPMELPQARQIVFMVTSHLQQNSFLQNLNARVAALGAEATDLQKNEALQQELLGAWMEVLPKFGFEGDRGYVQFQAALVQHSSDQEIATMINGALMAVSKHAGLAK